MAKLLGSVGISCKGSLQRAVMARPQVPATTAATAAARAAQGPMGPAPARNKPDWVRILEEDAAVDEEVAELLRGTDGDPDKIRAKMEQKLQSPFGSTGVSSSSSGTAAGSSGPAGLPFEARTGSDIPPHITFRDVDVFDLWVWLEFVVPPAQREKELLQNVLKSWFVVGKLGGFNSQNLQVYYNNSDDNSFLDYDSQEAGSALSAFMHSCSDAEFKGSWARFHVDLGTADELAFDILINMLVGFSFEVSGISRIMIGGEHERWEVPARVTAEEELGWDSDEDGRPKKEHGQAPKVGINPMKLPQGLEQELEMLDELGSWYDQQQQPQQQAQQQQQTQQQQQGAPQPRREWGRGLRPLGGAAVKGSFLPKQQQQQQQQQGQQQQEQPQRLQQPPPPKQQQQQQQQGRPVGAAAGSQQVSSSRSRSERRMEQLERLRKVQQMGQEGVPSGMTMYSEEDFKRAFNVTEDD